MINRATLKERAKSLFQGFYWPCVALFAIFGAITGTVSAGFSFSGSSASSAGNLGNIFKGTGSSAAQSISPAVALVIAGVGALASVIGILYYIFVAGPFSVSAAKTGLNVYDGHRPLFRDIVYCFRDGRYKNCVGGMALYMLFSDRKAHV